VPALSAWHQAVATRRTCCAADRDPRSPNRRRCRIEESVTED